MGKRNRISRPVKIRAAEVLSDQYGVTYSQAVIAIKRSETVRTNEPTLQICAWVIGIQIAINNFRSKRFRKVS